MSNVVDLPYEFYLRPYQEEPWDAMLDPDFHRGVMVVPRRNGKDILCWNGLIAKAFQRVGLYYYIAPYYNQVRQIIWEGFDHSGRRFIDYIPQSLITNMTKLDMRIDLVNGSQIKLQGSDAIDRIVGTNPIGIVFTEYSLHKPQAWEYLRPILAENGGWAMFNGTPRGLNHLYELYNKANRSSDWYVQYLTRNDTGIPSLEAIQDDIDSGMPEELVQQEYYCSFLSGVTGSYYASILQKLREDGKITDVPYNPRLPVHTAWDLGFNDYTAIWFFQLYDKQIRCIDYFEDRNQSMTYYFDVMRQKHYGYGEHCAPHDIEVHEFSSGMTRHEKAQESGIDFIVTPKYSLADSHELVRDILWSCVFDANKCADGLNSLMSYQKKYNQALDTYSDTPVRNWAKHGADAFKTLAHNVEDLSLDYNPFESSFLVGNSSYKTRKVHRAYDPIVTAAA